jgi:peroxiredoxin
MTFINVEPYLLKDDQGQLQPVLDASGNLQPAPATLAFKLISEPFVFVIGADGKISSSFELVFSPDEIDAAIKAVEPG